MGPNRFTSRSKLIGYKWVFRTKYNIDGSLQTFKARLVSIGFTKKKMLIILILILQWKKLNQLEFYLH